MEDKPTSSSRGRRKRGDDNQQGSIEKKQKIKRGKWYEASIAAEKAGIDLTNLKKCGYHKESASRVNAASPYKSFTFYLTSETGQVASTDDMAISLAEFCRLCADINRVLKSEYTEELSDGCSELFHKYIGQLPNNVTIDDAVEKGWVILPTRLEEMKKAKADNDAAKKKKSSEQKEETESSTAGNSTSNGDMSTSSGSPSNASASNDRSLTSENMICIGLTSEKVKQGAKNNPSYCYENFDFCKEAFRAKNCLLSREGSMDDESVSLVGVCSVCTCIMCVRVLVYW